MLIDEFLPRYQFAERHSIAIAAPPERVWAAIQTRDILADDPIVRAMLALRSAPSALWQRLRPTTRPTMTTFGMHSFTVLGYGDHETVAGLIGRFWQPGGGLRDVPDAAAWLAFGEKGTPKLAMNFVCTPRDGGCLLATQTRVVCPDARSRILFTPHWLAIRLGSGFIRERFLRAIKRAAEKGMP